MTMTTENEVPPFNGHGTVTIARQQGPENVPALVHPLCPGLAVTMADFGEFRVTHIASGRVIGGRYERWGSAALEMVEWTLIARALGVSWEEPDGAVILAGIKAGWDQPVPFPGATEMDKDGTRPCSIKTWMEITRGAFDDEFPWESPDEAPDSKAMDLLATMLEVPDA